MTLLTVAELRAFPAFAGRSDVDDAVLEVLLEAAESAIERELGGPVGAVQEVISGDLLTFLTLRRRATSITSITTAVDGVTTNLAADDYRLAYDRRTIWRLGDGTNPSAYWPSRPGIATVVYAAEDDEADRKRVQAQLVDLDLNAAPGVSMEQIGAWMETRQQNATWNQATERKAILATLWGADWSDFA